MTKTLLLSLEDIAYMAGHADSVDQRRRLDLLLRSTLTYVEEKEKVEDDSEAGQQASA